MKIGFTVPSPTPSSSIISIEAEIMGLEAEVRSLMTRVMELKVELLTK
nr:MAG TPA: hypothetical protein [Caudoviricetes sp.]